MQSADEPRHHAKAGASDIAALADAERFLLSLPPSVLLEPGAHPLIVQAYILASESHDGQRRKDGAPYIMHPIAVAKMLATVYPALDAEMVCAALLHDVIEDCGVSKEQIEAGTTARVAELVDGLTKIDDPVTGNAHEEKTFGKLQSFAKGHPLIVFIKFADLLHNLETLEFLPPARRENFVHRVLTRYVPLAHGLKREDLAELLERKARKHQKT